MQSTIKDGNPTPTFSKSKKSIYIKPSLIEFFQSEADKHLSLISKMFPQNNLKEDLDNLSEMLLEMDKNVNIRLKNFNDLSHSDYNNLLNDFLKSEIYLSFRDNDYSMDDEYGSSYHNARRKMETNFLQLLATTFTDKLFNTIFPYQDRMLKIFEHHFGKNYSINDSGEILSINTPDDDKNELKTFINNNNLDRLYFIVINLGKETSQDNIHQTIKLNRSCSSNSNLYNVNFKCNVIIRDSIYLEIQKHLKFHLEEDLSLSV